jgi:hypothetical protein
MKKFLLTVVFAIALHGFLLAQDEQDSTVKVLEEQLSEVEGSVDGINETVLEMKSVLDALKKIKISGYIQAQFQSAESDGANSVYQGGAFPSTTHNRFMIRRGRIKFNYDNDLTQYVLQLDATERGVSLKDAYISIKDPWLKTFGLTGGVFDRPFGFEISYSSSMRESPERSRLFQTLFPGERDLGAKLEITPQDGFFSFLNFKGGLFTGNGVNPETDNAKDFIGRLGFQLPFYEANLAIDGGVSGYFGQVRIDNPRTVNNVVVPYKAYTVDSPTSFAVDSTTRYWDRNYIGGDLEIYYDLPILGGFSLRGEYIQGKNPGNQNFNLPYRATTGDLYMRNFYGYYLQFTQNIGLSNQLVLKYDVMDPNKDVTGDDIGLPTNTRLTAADLKYTTIGVGWVYHWDSNVKFVLYYDMITNEKVAEASTVSSLAPLKDDLKDDVVTFRMQYKF